MTGRIITIKGFRLSKDGKKLLPSLKRLDLPTRLKRRARVRIKRGAAER